MARTLGPRAFVIGASMAVLAVALAFPATAAAKVYLFPKLNQTSFGYQEQTYQPSVIDLPDDLQAVQIRWTHWGSRRARGVGHVIDEPHNQLTFIATAITSDARTVAKCDVHAPPVIRYYARLIIHAATPALQQDDMVAGNFAASPTVQC